VESAATGLQEMSVVSNSNQLQRMKTVLMKSLHVNVKGTNSRVQEMRLLFDEGRYVKISVAENLQCKKLESVVI